MTTLADTHRAMGEELAALRARFTDEEDTMTTDVMAELASKVNQLPGGFMTRSGRRPDYLRVKCSAWGRWCELSRAEVEALLSSTEPTPPRAA